MLLSLNVIFVFGVIGMFASKSQKAAFMPANRLLSVARALESIGVDSQCLYEEEGIEFTALRQPGKQLPMAVISRLLHRAALQSNNPAIGLEMGKFFHLPSSGLIGYSLFASHTLRDCCYRLHEYSRLITPDAEHQIIETDKTLEMIIPVLTPPRYFEAIDLWISGLVNLFRMMYRPDFKPLRVDLMRPKIEGSNDVFEYFFGCPVNYGCSENRFLFDMNDMREELVSIDAELQHISDQFIVRELARAERNDIVSRSKVFIYESLEQGNIGKPALCRMLGMSESTLDRRLKSNNTSYKKILDQCRHDLAREYLKDHKHSIKEISLILGYTACPNFSRSFNRMEGISPQEFRKRQQLDTSES